MVKDEQIVGEALARVLPRHEKAWFRIPHLLKLNLILLVPLLSSAVAGYDGSMMNGKSTHFQSFHTGRVLTSSNHLHRAWKLDLKGDYVSIVHQSSFHLIYYDVFSAGL